MRLTKYISLIIKRSAIEFDIRIKNKTNLDDHLKYDIKCAVTEEKTSDLEEVIGDENILVLYNKLLTERETEGFKPTLFGWIQNDRDSFNAENFATGSVENEIKSTE